MARRSDHEGYAVRAPENEAASETLIDHDVPAPSLFSIAPTHSASASSSRS